MMQKFSKSELEAKSIFEMRALAKEVGISAPTKMNKAELVDMVFKITNGEIEPPQAPRRGRPKSMAMQPNKRQAKNRKLLKTLLNPSKFSRRLPQKLRS